MDIVKFVRRQDVSWFRGDREIDETNFKEGDELLCEILCKEENLPRHQNDPIYYYTVRNQRGHTAVIHDYLNRAVNIRRLEGTEKQEEMQMLLRPAFSTH